MFPPVPGPGGLSGSANSKKPAQAARDGGEGARPAAVVMAAGFAVVGARSWPFVPQLIPDARTGVN